MDKTLFATKINPLERSVFTGVALILLGGFLALLSILIPPLGLLLLPGGWLLYKGSRAAAGTHRVSCPFCGKAGFLAANQRVYRCGCGRKSVKDESYLLPVQNDK